MDAPSTLPLEAPPAETGIHWFAPYCCVVERGAMCEVLVGGTLIGQFERDGRDRGARNVLLVTLAQEPRMHLGRLAAAFGVSEEYLRILRRKAEAGGLGAVLLRRTGGKERVTARQRARLRRWFAEGLRPAEAFRRQPKRNRLSVATVQREHVRWRKENEGGSSPPAPVAVEPQEPQLRLFPDGAQPPGTTDDRAAADEAAGAVRPIAAAPVESCRGVQHLGSWIMLAMAHAQGL